MKIDIIDNTIFVLEMENSSYIMKIMEDKTLCLVHWGEKIEHPEEFLREEKKFHCGNHSVMQKHREECSSLGGMRFKEPSFQAEFADGTRDFRYSVSAYEVKNNELTITLKDDYYPFQVILHYEIKTGDILEKWREYINTGETPIVLRSAYSAEYPLMGEGYKTCNFTGRWSAEYQWSEEELLCGKKIYQSSYGLTGHGNHPIFYLHKNASLDYGNVYFGVLKYSGDFKVVCEVNPFHSTTVLLGISDEDFSCTLNSNESFVTPVAAAGFTTLGENGVVHALELYSKDFVMPQGRKDKVLPVLYNSWYATEFDLNIEQQKKLAKKAAELGTELFVVDDGWFLGRKNDRAGLGDWVEDPDKFPEGMEPLISYVKKLGMGFGLWIEPEMVNPLSNLYKEHPEWVYRYKNREVLMGRNQYMLDMSSKEVRDYLFRCFDNLLNKYQIDYIKWDMNRYAGEQDSQVKDRRRVNMTAYDHTMGVYDLIKRLRQAHPKVEFEACAAGAGRIDYGAMQYFDEYWTSDNTDPLDRLFMQRNYLRFYPAGYMRAWYTEHSGMDHRTIPLRFSMYVSMCGALGIGLNLSLYEDAFLQELKSYISLYKRVEKTVQCGSLIHLTDNTKDTLFALQYQNMKQTVVFAFSIHEMYGDGDKIVKIRNLNNIRYRVEIDGKAEMYYGDYLMNHGITLDFAGDYASYLIIIEEA